jgi:type VI secretion system protein ImpM
MIRGIFGKLPAKRDFVAARIPPGVLHPFEAWLQTSLAVSRQKMGAGWTEAYLRAPIWRFWIGRQLFGQPVIGAMMPSLDAVGRYFPLAVLFIPPESRTFPPPSRNAQDEWFLPLEDCLLRALEQDATYERLVEDLDALAPPQDDAEAAVAGIERITGNAVRAVAEDAAGLSAALAFAHAEEIDDALQHLTVWWTLGGEGFAAQAISTRQLPPHDTFAHFLMGDAPAAQPVDEVAG